MKPLAAVLLLPMFACASRSAVPSVVTPAPAPAREQLSLTYFGVAGWSISSGSSTILIDPYFSRPDLSAAAIQPDAAAIATHAPAAADLILVTHSHVDHALDVPAVALRTGANIVGTQTTAALALASNVPSDKIITVGGGEDYSFGNFSVGVLQSLHSALDDKHWAGGKTFAEPPVMPLSMDGYPDGGTLAFLVRLGGHKIFISGTANFIEREITGLAPDIAIVGTGLRQEITDYTCRLLTALSFPPVVIANHFDNWRGPAVDAPPDEDLLAFVAEVEACAAGTRVIIPNHFARFELR